MRGYRHIPLKLLLDSEPARASQAIVALLEQNQFVLDATAKQIGIAPLTLTRWIRGSDILRNAIDEAKARVAARAGEELKQLTAMEE